MLSKEIGCTFAQRYTDTLARAQLNDKLQRNVQTFKAAIYHELKTNPFTITFQQSTPTQEKEDTQSLQQ